MISAVTATSMPYVLPHNPRSSTDRFFRKIAEISKIAAWGTPHCCTTGIGCLPCIMVLQPFKAGVPGKVPGA
jgi:hypothetical protein